jgi:hypothetical protein
MIKTYIVTDKAEMFLKRANRKWVQVMTYDERYKGWVPLHKVYQYTLKNLKNRAKRRHKKLEYYTNIGQLIHKRYSEFL